METLIAINLEAVHDRSIRITGKVHISAIKVNVIRSRYVTILQSDTAFLTFFIPLDTVAPISLQHREERVYGIFPMSSQGISPSSHKDKQAFSAMYTARNRLPICGRKEPVERHTSIISFSIGTLL